MKAILTAFSLLVMLSGAPSQLDLASTATASPEPLELFRQYATAISGSNVNDALALFADDAVLTPGGPGGGGRCPGGACAGKEAIRAQIQGQVSDQHQISLLGGQKAADGVTAAGKYTLRSRQTAAAGVERIVFNFQLAEVSSLIGRLIFSPDLTDPATASFFQRREGAPMQPPGTGDAGLATAR